MTQPGSFGAGWPKDESYLIRRIEDLERTVKELRAARTLESSSIGAGGLQIIQDGSVDVVDSNTNRNTAHFGIGGFASTPAEGYTRQMITRLNREDGSVALILADLNATPGHPFKQSLQTADRNGNVIFSDDTNSGIGIARPYFPTGVFASIAAPTDTTTSATFVALQWADTFQQHPQVSADVLVQTQAGTTGEVRMTMGGVQIGSVVSVAANFFSNLFIPQTAWPSYSFGARINIQLEARRTAGTGTIGVRGLGLWGMQSP